jgi:hypothetical protein
MDESLQNLMANSFYYFFSATPQVLGGILALFAVFVIFKIQILRSHLIGFGVSLLNYSAILSQEQISDKCDDFSFRNILKASTSINDVEGLKEHLNTITNPEYVAFKNEFNKVYDSLLRLIKSTIRWSIVTASTIILCLITIPFSCFILNYCWLLYDFYFIVIALSILCFYNLIRILRKSLFDKL